MASTTFIRKLAGCELAHADQNLENFIIVWLDVTIDQTNDSLDTKARLRTVVNHLKTFQDADTCIKYLSSIENEKILLILSGSLAVMNISTIHLISQVEAIYIFCLDENRYETLLINSKIRGIFTDKDLLILKLQEDAKLFAHDIMPMNVFCLQNSEHSIHDLTQESTSFLWNQLLIDVLLKLSRDEQSKIDIIHQCRSYYRDNDEELKEIEDFRLSYSSDQAISWYTRDSFIYRLLNKALRTQDIDVIFQFRFFIIDLYFQLKNEHAKFIDMFRDNEGTIEEFSLTIYRGQKLKTHELQILQENIGKLVSVNTFFSTTYEKDVALMYASNTNDISSSIVECILFEIEISTTVNTQKPFANIKQISFMKDENEILFSIGTIFLIKSIEKQNHIWIIKLKLNSDYPDDDPMTILSRQISQQSSDQYNKLNSLGYLLLEMGAYKKACQRSPFGAKM